MSNQKDEAAKDAQRQIEAEEKKQKEVTIINNKKEII
jgi:hypothetical protein